MKLFFIAVVTEVVRRLSFSSVKVKLCGFHSDFAEA